MTRPIENNSSLPQGLCTRRLALRSAAGRSWDRLTHGLSPEREGRKARRRTMSHMKRRGFIVLIGGAAAWPLAARAQQPAMPVVGFLSSASPEAFAPYLDAFRLGLEQAGFVEGANVTIVYCWARGRDDRLPALAAELVERKVAVIAASGEPAVMAAKAATATTPIIFLLDGDPVRLGLVAGCHRPGGNLSGVTVLTLALDLQRLALLREALPKVARVAVLINPNFPGSPTRLRAMH